MRGCGTAWCGHLPVTQEIRRVRFPYTSPNQGKVMSLSNEDLDNIKKTHDSIKDDVHGDYQKQIAEKYMISVDELKEIFKPKQIKR